MEVKEIKNKRKPSANYRMTVRVIDFEKLWAEQEETVHKQKLLSGGVQICTGKNCDVCNHHK